MEQGFILGLDIGYSNVKLIGGESGHGGPEWRRSYPAGAGPVANVAAEFSNSGGVEIEYQGAPWLSLIEPSRFENFPRTLHADYPSTAVYQALLRGALAESGRSTINTLVTGLPVTQFFANGTRQRLSEDLRGRIEIRKSEAVVVEKVHVIPQPLGAFLSFASRYPDPDAIPASNVLVIDPGFFSFDWVIVSRGDLRRSSSGTSTHAASYLLEETSRLIADETNGGRVSRDALERALRDRQTSVMLYGEKLELAPYMRKAAARAAGAAFQKLLSSVRQEQADSDFDFVVLAGGGADLYGSSARRIFPRAKVVLASQAPVMANADGFWVWGSDNG